MQGLSKREHDQGLRSRHERHKVIRDAAAAKFKEDVTIRRSLRVMETKSPLIFDYSAGMSRVSGFVNFCEESKTSYFGGDTGRLLRIREAQISREAPSISACFFL
jgi:hypothetical protein